MENIVAIVLMISKTDVGIGRNFVKEATASFFSVPNITGEKRLNAYKIQNTAVIVL